MRLLHVHSGNLWGGVESVLLTIARHDAGAVFALAYDGRLARELRAAGREIYILGEARASRPLSIHRARRKLSRLRADAVVVHNAWSAALLGPAAGLPVIFYLHDSWNPNGWLERWARLSPPDLILANSRFTANTLARINAPVGVLHPPSAFPSHASNPRKNRTGLIILQASRFEPWKGHSEHLDALALLNHRDDWTLWIAGSPQRSAECELRTELERKARDLGISDRVRFIGHQPDMHAIMAAADIYCQPNRGPEPFGLTFIEAMAASLPVITSDLGGAREIVDERCGFRVPPSDSCALAKTLETLLSNRELREQLGAPGPQRARFLCDPVKQIAQLHRAAESLVAGAFRAA